MYWTRTPFAKGCAMLQSDHDIAALLQETRTIAVVGASAKESRPSNEVMRYLLTQGYEVFPINPGHAGETIHGQTVYASLADLPAPPDMVDIFRRSEDVGPVVDDAIACGAKSIWMQMDIINEDAAARAEAAGLKVVMNRCPKIEIPRLGLPPIG